MASFKTGNKETFKWLVERLGRPLLHYGINIISSPTIVHEMPAAAFLKVLHMRDSMMSVDHINRSLFVIVRNEIIDEVRSGRAKLIDKALGFDDVAEDSIHLMIVQSDLIKIMYDKIDAFPEVPGY